jgi:SAM-dependent methyltransferase
MNHFLNGVARAVGETFDLPSPILEVGSYQVEGQEEIADIRPFFGDKSYVGIDVRQGPGVDQVADVERLPYPDRSFGTVIALSTFEHVPHFWRGFDEIYRVLRPDGAFFVSCPFNVRIHNYPNDYWRFTPEAFELLLCDYPSKIIGWHGPTKRPENVWALAFREDREPITRGQFEAYRNRLQAYGRQPLQMSRKLQYRLGRLLCGPRPFAPYLDQQRWETECRTAPLS